jgi:hypothetical protein
VYIKINQQAFLLPHYCTIDEVSKIASAAQTNNLFEPLKPITVFVISRFSKICSYIHATFIFNIFAGSYAAIIIKDIRSTVYEITASSFDMLLSHCTSILHLYKLAMNFEWGKIYGEVDTESPIFQCRRCISACPLNGVGLAG